MWRANCTGRNATPGHQYNGSTSIVSSSRPLTSGYACYRDISPTAQIRAEVRMSTDHALWARDREASEVIDLHELFSDYWSSNNHEFTVLSQSITTNQSAQI